MHELLDSFSAKFPEMNVLLYRNPKSKLTIDDRSEAFHVEYMLPNGYGGDKGYWNIWLLNEATFELQGDGGWENWGYTGNWDRDGNCVEFYYKDEWGMK